MSPTGRTQQTARLLGTPGLEVVPDRRPLDGATAWEERERAWAAGQDVRPEGGESLADGQRRAAGLLARAREGLEPGQHVVLVTHGDIASVVIGELRGTPLLERPSRDGLAAGDVRPGATPGREEI